MPFRQPTGMAQSHDCDCPKQQTDAIFSPPPNLSSVSRLAFSGRGGGGGLICRNSVMGGGGWKSVLENNDPDLNNFLRVYISIYIYIYIYI